MVWIYIETVLMRTHIHFDVGIYPTVVELLSNVVGEITVELVLKGLQSDNLNIR